jgi:hypothetical protein
MNLDWIIVHLDLARAIFFNLDFVERHREGEALERGGAM